MKLEVGNLHYSLLGWIGLGVLHVALQWPDVLVGLVMRRLD